MGYMRHHAIIVTTFDENLATRAYDAANRIFCDSDSAPVSSVLQTQINSYFTILIAPDGSKEGWETSNKGDAQRARFVEWLHGQEYEDGSSCFSWAEVQFGDEDGLQQIVRASR